MLSVGPRKLSEMIRTGYLSLALAAAFGCSARSPSADLAVESRGGTALLVHTDAASYHLVPNPAVPGAHRLLLVATLTNSSPDTAWLRFPCDIGPQPARAFLFANNLSEGFLGFYACLASSAGVGSDTHGLALPPRTIFLDSIVVEVPAYRLGEHELRLTQYLGTYRLAYARRRPPRRGRNDWTDYPLSATVSAPFRVMPPT